MKSAAIGLCLLLISNTVLQAESIEHRYGLEDGLIQLNERWFDLHAPIPEYFVENEFAPLDRIRWIQDILNEDPLLGSAVVHIFAQPQDARRVFNFDLGGGYDPIENPPAWLRLPGWDIRGSDGNWISIMAMPAVPTPQERVKCSIRPDDFDTMCFVSADYPDPRLFVKARMYGRYTFEEFAPRIPAVATRIREIAYCLDVTDEVLAGTWRPSPPPENTRLEDCGEEVIS